jgi:ASCH domain
MATELADLVIAGIKRATASLARVYGEGCEPIPRPGDLVLMLDGEGRARFIWRTTEVTIKPLSQVDVAFAWTKERVTAVGNGGSTPTADISLDKQGVKDSSATTISLPYLSGSRSSGRSTPESDDRGALAAKQRGIRTIWPVWRDVDIRPALGSRSFIRPALAYD